MLIRTLSVAAVIMMTVAFPTPAAAQFTTGNQLLEDCTAERGTSTFYQNQADCMGYIAGVIDQFIFQRMVMEKADCVPKITKGQARDILVAFLQKNPADRHHPAAVLVTLAIMEAYPDCLN